MEKQNLNLFIVANNALVVNGLRHYLEGRFGSDVIISNFYDSKSCLKKINENPNVVVLDYFLSGKSGLEVSKRIKSINPQIEVIMHSSNEDVAASLEAFRKGYRGGVPVKRFSHKFANQYN